MKPTDRSGRSAIEPDVKRCCAAVYESGWARLLLGDSFHPGGPALTERLGKRLHLTPEDVVLDVAMGRGTSAIQVARRFGCRVIGVDLSKANVAAAQAAAGAAGVAERATFVVGDAEQLPLTDDSVTAVICECAFCTFPDKGAAMQEFARVLCPRGRIGLADLTRSGALPEELESLLAWVACIADAQPVEEYRRFLLEAGFGEPLIEPRDEALAELVRGIQLKLVGADLLATIGKLPLPVSNLREAKRLAQAAHASIQSRQLGYALFIASAP